MRNKMYQLRLTDNARDTVLTTESLDEMVEALRGLADDIEAGYLAGPVSANKLEGPKRNPCLCGFSVVHEEEEILNRLKEETK